jgi:TfoX/Sxy family transcriptional regulator of competence genes
MFGGVGIYAGNLFFALIADDTVYFKVDAATRPQFEERGMAPSLEAQASSFAHRFRRLSSAALGSLVSNVPVVTSPAGS